MDDKQDKPATTTTVDPVTGMATTTILMGDNVFCDYCDKDYTNLTDGGGFQFQSKAVCPDCEDDMLRTISSYGEERYIRAVNADPDRSFADWVREVLR